MTPETSSNDTGRLDTWDPDKQLRSVSALEARFSRGFLQSLPAKWFPGLPSHWLPLFHSLGLEFKVVEVKPTIDLPKDLSFGFSGKLDGDFFGVAVDEIARQATVDCVVPNAVQPYSNLVLEYLGRRLLGSLVASWSGPETSIFHFEKKLRGGASWGTGAVKLGLQIKGSRLDIWILLGQSVIEKLDTLWRRQIHSVVKPATDGREVRLEIARVAVSPANLSDYTTPGTVVDLEIPLSDMCNLTSAGRVLQSAKMCIVEGHLGIEIVPGPVRARTLPEGKHLVSVELGKVQFDTPTFAEMSQAGAIWKTDILSNDKVDLVSNSEVLAKGKLCCYQGRFAVTVI